VTAEHERKQPVILVLWHGQLLPLLWAHRNQQISIIISEHRDGEIIARVAAALGCRSVRGSSSRGAARALLSACREVEAGYDLAITPDGPRGPARSVAPGSVVISQRTGAPMVPVAAWANKAWRLRSWDSFLIPKPFARVTVAYSDPIRVAAETPRGAADEIESVRGGIDTAEKLAAS
jgi:Kdo2-lipid IVA 3' secondary acyltransferase